MDNFKHVKVKSRWTQSCQMDMLTEESQSSLEMSDSITDVSTSDLNENTDHSSELYSLEGRSPQTNCNKTNYKEFSVLKTTQQINTLTFNNSNRRSPNIKQSLQIHDNDKKEKNHQECNNIIEWTSVNWNNMAICQTREKSKSFNDISDSGLVKKLPSKLFRRASLSWEFRYTSTNEKDNNYYNHSNLNKHFNSKKRLLEIQFLSTDYNKLCNEDKFLLKNENTSQKLYYSNPMVNKNDNGHTEVLLNMNKLEISKANASEKEQSEYLNEHIMNSDADKTYKIPKLSLVDLDNLRYSRSVYRYKEIRSKSLDFLKTKKKTLKRSFSCDDVKKLKNSMVVTFISKRPQRKSPKKKRRQSKRIKPKIKNMDMFDDIIVPKIDYNEIADKIYQEHKNQLLEARIKDNEFDQKLKSTNFILVNENIYQPDKQTLKCCQPSEMSALLKLKQRVISLDLSESCECTLSKDDINEGHTACGDDKCGNRLLKIECGSGCRFKQYCSNKQIQNKQFKKISIIKTENKGYGICAVEDIPKGVLICEYVGEVIGYNEMCDRLTSEEYANLNYMVRVNHDEIIDSTSKGNLTRFINHSCDPNSVSEQWHVLGQSRIGFFSTRNIKKGEEITFDYSFQVFGDNAQICYCGSSKCRGYISKAIQITGLSCSEDSDVATEVNTKPEEKHRKRKIFKKRIVCNDKNKLRELSRQLKEIAKLKTGLKADQEMATLNLNRLMVHITDSKSRWHVLTFIQGEHDMNKRLFMDFSGLSIIHNWMTSNENDESFKMMILDILTELPIANRNTITKSKVLDVVAEWAEIPQDIKSKIESLEYPPIEQQKHCQEIDNILPKNNEGETINKLVEKARALWKKWIILKMVFKIPKKNYQHKAIKEINSNKPTDESYALAMDIPVLDQNTFKFSNKFINKAQNKPTISLERKKSKKEYEFKNSEQERPKIFRKKVIDNWSDQYEDVIKKKVDGYCIQSPTSNLHHCNNSVNHNMTKRTRWDCSSSMAHLRHNSIANHNVQIPCLNFMPPQALQKPLVQYPLYHIQPQMVPKDHIFNPYTIFNTPPPPLPNQHQKSNALSINKPVHQNIEPSGLSPTRHLFKSADSKVFNLINESLSKHYNSHKNIEADTHSINESCSRAVKSGIDLLARIKVLSNSFKNQPSKLININNSKYKSGKTKFKNMYTSDFNLKSVCDINNKLMFINEQAGVTSNILSEDVLSIPKTITLFQKNIFAANILNSLLKKTDKEKENLIPKKFILKNLNSDIITSAEADKEIELYKNMKPQVIKKIVGHVKTTNGFATVMKRQWGIKIKGLPGNSDKIPVTKRNLMRRGNIHRLSLKNGLNNKTKSALKRHNNINMDDYERKPKEKRVTFLIEGEESPIFPHSEVRPINLNQNLVKQKPLMKCHPFEIRNEPKSILQPTSNIEDGNLQLSLVEQQLETTNDQIIRPIVTKFKASRKRRISSQVDLSEQLEQFRIQRTHKIPLSMESLSLDVLKLIPDNEDDVKKVLHYHNLLVKVIVKILGPYSKKPCQQGRIRNDDDFKYVAKKITENVLLKELQLKKVDKLKISNSTKDKVAEYIRKYMSRFGEFYKRKPCEKTKLPPS